MRGRPWGVSKSIVSDVDWLGSERYDVECGKRYGEVMRSTVAAHMKLERPHPVYWRLIKFDNSFASENCVIEWCIVLEVIMVRTNECTDDAALWKARFTAGH